MTSKYGQRTFGINTITLANMTATQVVTLPNALEMKLKK